MRENILHYIWKYQKFTTRNLKTQCGQAVEVYSVGDHNKDSGPDFLFARLRVGKILWIGQIEIHVNASDWNDHGHQYDEAYYNVVLHVVWNHDRDIHRPDGTLIPVLSVEPYVSHLLLQRYEQLFLSPKNWINCENDFQEVDQFKFDHWIERLYFERLQRKTEEIKSLLSKEKYHWEAVLFQLLSRSFGMKLNADAFLSIAKSIPFKILQKNRDRQFNLEALLLGQARLLEVDIPCDYLTSLRAKYDFLKYKYHLENRHTIKPKLFRLRPSNFPTIRLSQLAQLFHLHGQLFSKLLPLKELSEYTNILSVSASTYWDTHYTFGTPSKVIKKTSTASFISIVLLNAVIPLKFVYREAMGHTGKDDLIQLLRTIKGENNSVLRKFDQKRALEGHALESQGLLELKTNYCDKNKCLDCEIGNYLLNRNM